MSIVAITFFNIIIINIHIYFYTLSLALSESSCLIESLGIEVLSEKSSYTIVVFEVEADKLESELESERVERR